MQPVDASILTNRNVFLLTKNITKLDSAYQGILSIFKIFTIYIDMSIQLPQK